MLGIDINLWDFYENSARCWPNKKVIGLGDQSYTYVDFRKRVEHLSSYLSSENMEFQENVVVLSPNSIQFVQVMLANVRMGLITELINWRLAPERLCDLLNISTAKIVFFSLKCIDAYDYLRKNLSREVKYVCMDGYADGAVSWAEIEGMSLEYCPRRYTRDSDMVVQIYSSGTTSMPKAMLHSMKNFSTKAIISAVSAEWSSDEIYLLTSPLFHISCVGMFACFLAGATCIIGDPSTDGLIHAIQFDRATRIGVVPTTLNRLLDYTEAHPEFDHSSIRYIEYGTAPMTPEQISKVMKFFNCRLIQYYGMTETAAHIALLLPEHHLDERKRKSVGLPVLGTEIRIVQRDGSECRTGEPGEIIVRHPCTIDSYLNNPELTKETLVGEWYYTGDIGYLDDEGFLFLVDRKKDMIISGGENIYPKEIVTCILSMGDEIIDVAVAGVPDDVYGEAVMAVVVKANDSAITKDDITEYCKAHLASYKKPRFVYFVDKLPLNDMGKINRTAVKAIHLSQVK
ncbi:MAG: AMP-binding protein [Oscillospiraceae bacterium]